MQLIFSCSGMSDIGSNTVLVRELLSIHRMADRSIVFKIEYLFISQFIIFFITIYTFSILVYNLHVSYLRSVTDSSFSIAMK